MRSILAIAISLLIGSNSFAQASKGERRTLQPEALASLITANADSNMLILNTGPVDDIKHAVNIGAVSEEKNLKKLKRYLKNVPRDKEVIIYCGCCPFASCPNLNPAYDLLAEMNFTNYKILLLPEDLKMDWIDKGYPMAEE